MTDEKQIEEKIKEIEEAMARSDFWEHKERAQEAVKELNELKQKLENAKAVDRGDAIFTILSGAGGDDAEDFSRILLEMYLKYFSKRGWTTSLIHENKNDHGGYRNITLEVIGKNAYGSLKNESGVHRLVRISPFNAKKMRHTSFSMVEVLPKLPKTFTLEIPDKDLRIDFARSGGAGGQNVNKRETAVRIVHIPTGLSVHSTGERSQAQNREKGLEILKAKIFKLEKEKNKAAEEGLKISKTIEIEWGNQIRSYVLHPYKMVKDHRTGVETSNIEKVLEGGLDEFVDPVARERRD